MTLTVEIYDGAAWVEVDSTYVLMIEYDDGGTSKLNSARITFSGDVLGTTPAPVYQNELRILSDGTVFFAGRIERPVTENPLYIVDVDSYGDEFLDLYVNEVFTNVSPEYIFQYIIENYTTLTYASTVTTGFTIPRMVVRDKRVIEVLQAMCNLVDYVLSVDSSKNAYFEPRATVNTGVSLTVGTEVVFKPSWDYNPDFITTNIVVEGDKQQFSTSQSFTATASQTAFTLAYEPSGNVSVTDNGTAKTPYIDGTGDYTLDPANKKITFATGRTAGHTIVINYSYYIPIKIEKQSEIYDDYGNLIKKQFKITNKTIQSFSDARAFANKYLSLHSQPSKSTTLSVQGINTSIKSGQLIQIVDAYESTQINEQFVVLGVKYAYPSDMSEIKVGTVEQLYFNYHKEVIERIRNIEQENTNIEKLQIYTVFDADLNVAYGMTYTLKERYMSNSFITGHDTLAYLRADLNQEPDCSGNTNHGTWSGSGISGSQYSASGYRLGCGSYDGTSNYVSTTGSASGVVSASFCVYPTANNVDVLRLATGKYISINSSSQVTSTGLSGVTYYVNAVASQQITLNTWNHVVVNFSSTTADSIRFGHNSSYYKGRGDEFLLFNSTLSATDISDLYAKNFGSYHSKYANCKLWWSFDDPRLGDRRTSFTVLETG